MFTTLIAEAAAAVPGDVTGLERYPIVEMVVAVLTFFLVGGGAVLWRRGENARPAPPAGSPVQVYMDGPLVEVLQQTRRIAASFERIPDLMVEAKQIRDELNERHEAAMNEMRKAHRDLETRLRDAEQALAVLEALRQQPGSHPAPRR